MSAPRSTTFAPAATASSIETESPATRTSSIGTTASAPSGRMPPVGIGLAAPAGSTESGALPIRTSPAIRNSPGVSLARSANPSITERTADG